MRKLVFVCLLAILASSAGFGAAIVFTGSSGDLAASATFATSGNSLLVTLTNTSGSDVLVPTDVLTGVFFNYMGMPSLAPVSAVLAPGSTVHFGSTDPGGVVGGEWAFVCGITGANPASCGISSTGLSIFGPHDRFPGSNLQGPDSPDGLQYGITSLGDNLATGNAPVIGDNALIKNSVAFTFNAPGFDPAAVRSVQFQYGTGLNEPRYPGNPESPVPEPATFALVGGVLVGAGFLRRRK